VIAFVCREIDTVLCLLGALSTIICQLQAICRARGEFAGIRGSHMKPECATDAALIAKMTARFCYKTSMLCSYFLLNQ
jgi:hypothetical protein